VIGGTLIKTEEQRRWWFATHPEYSRRRTGQRSKTRGNEDKKSDKSPPELVDEYVDEKLKYEKDSITRELLQLTKRWFGTEGQTRESYEELGLKWPGEADYKEGWNDGYWAIHRRKTPPDLDIKDKSPYAQGVREGAAAALDENEAWAQKWLDPISILLGSHPSYKLRKELTKHDGPRPSPDHDGHHIVAWRHWRAGPARDVLEKFGIEINSAENGVWLHRPYHQTLGNSYRYIDRVNRMLKKANTKQEAFKILGQMKHMLSINKFP
jgi:hypothetical protein